MSDPSTKTSPETTPLTQDHDSAHVSESPPPPYNPPPAYSEGIPLPSTKGVPIPDMTPPPEYKENSESFSIFRRF